MMEVFWAKAMNWVYHVCKFELKGEKIGAVNTVHLYTVKMWVIEIMQSCYKADQQPSHERLVDYNDKKLLHLCYFTLCLKVDANF